MDNKLTNVLISLAVILVIFAVIMFAFGTQESVGPFNFSVDQATLVLRFVFVIVGLLIAFAIYYFTRQNAAWEIGTRQVVWMAIGAALYAVQGGEPSTDLSNVALNDAITFRTPALTEREQATEIADRAKALQTDFRELVEAMWDQRQVLDSTPSIVPVRADSYWFSSGFGWRRSPFTGAKEFHNGLDICSSKGTPIVAPADGVVYRKGQHRYLGKYIRINHGRGITTTYGHLSGLSVERGQKVKRGDIIGFMGNTGRSVGTHLHYSLKVKTKYVNPFHYILNTRRNRLVDFYQETAGGGK